MHSYKWPLALDKHEEEEEEKVKDETYHSEPCFDFLRPYKNTILETKISESQ